VELQLMPTNAPRGRGAADNPPNRFVPLHYAADPDCPPEDAPAPHTQFLRDSTRSIIATNDSPDVGFSHSVNPYRGCEHGCSYCYARPFHEYLGFSAGLDFESKIMVKEDAPELLRRELMAKSWKPVTLAFSGVTDCYQPIERKLKLTRRCLEVCAEFRNPVGVISKNALVARDADVLADLARDNAARAFLSVTTLDADLAGKLEPRASRPAARLAAMRALHEAGVPVGVMIAPVIPGLTDHETPAILAACRDAGARQAGYVALRLPHAVGPLFSAWLERHYPAQKDKVLDRVREMRGGRLYDSRFGNRQRGEGEWAEVYRNLFKMSCKRVGINERDESLNAAAFRRPGERSLFD
jgi:DNA repair photolyase